MGKDGACQDRSNVQEKFKNTLRKAKHFWHSIKRIHKKVWTSTGRKHLVSAFKGLLKSLVVALKEVWKFTMGCPATKMIATVLGMIVGLVIVNMAFVAAGFVVIPLLIKLVGGLVGLYMSFEYMKNTVIYIYKEIKKVRAGKCATSCKKGLIEKSSAMVGAIVEVILLGGMDDFAKVKKKPETINLFKKYKIQPSDSFIADMGVLKNAAKKSKQGVKASIKRIGKKIGAMKETGVTETIVDIANNQRKSIEASLKVAGGKAKKAVTHVGNKAKQLRSYVASTARDAGRVIMNQADNVLKPRTHKKHVATRSVGTSTSVKTGGDAKLKESPTSQVKVDGKGSEAKVETKEAAGLKKEPEVEADTKHTEPEVEADATKGDADGKTNDADGEKSDADGNEVDKKNEELEADVKKAEEESYEQVNKIQEDQRKKDIGKSAEKYNEQIENKNQKLTQNDLKGMSSNDVELYLEHVEACKGNPDACLNPQTFMKELK